MPIVIGSPDAEALAPPVAGALDELGVVEPLLQAASNAASATEITAELVVDLLYIVPPRASNGAGRPSDGILSID